MRSGHDRPESAVIFTGIRRRPLAKLVPVGTKVRFGVAKGKLHISDAFDGLDARVAKMFTDDGSIEPRT